MNYNLIISGNGGNVPDVPLGVFIRPEFERPRLGQELKYNGIIYRVVRCLPVNNPDNASVTYYIMPLNPKDTFYIDTPPA